LYIKFQFILVYFNNILFRENTSC